MENYYRVIVGTKGIYEAVEKDCQKNDPRRKNKPDGSWLPKAGLQYPGAIYFWKKNGLKKYIESGLLKWHASVVKGGVEILIIDKPEKLLYEDAYQIICESKEVKIKTREPVATFLKSFYNK